MKRLIAVIMLMMGTTVYAAAPARVLLLPFESVGDSPKPWVAKALQQNLIAELSRFSSATPVTGDTTATDMTDALKLAEKSKADYVVFGSYQAVEGDLRITGQVVDALKKESVAGLKTTGNLRDLFGLEDVIANQVKRSLPQPVVATSSDLLKQPVAPEPEAAPEAAPPTIAGLDDRMRELQGQLDQAIERMKYTPPYYGGDYYDSYPSNYAYSGFYSPYVYYTVPIYTNGFHRGGHHVDHHRGGTWNGGGTWHGGGGNMHGGGNTHGGGTWHGGGNVQGGGGGVVGHQSVGGGVQYAVPTGSNYMNFGRMSR